jgi:trans-aconitate 2-methyltransferase
MADVWNPNQYEKFKSERAKPFWDLVDLVDPSGIKTALDLGCGTGELTRSLHLRIRAERTIGVDNSPLMLTKARGFSAPGLEFKLHEIETYLPAEPMGLVFSNAALQWVGEHETIFCRLIAWLKPGGQLAIQVPANFDHPSHRIAEEVAKDLFPAMKFATRTDAVLPIERYAGILYNNGLTDQRCRVEVYGHPMASGAEVVEWTKGTLLTHYQKELSPAEFERYLAEYQRRVLAEIGEGPYFYPFKRILMWGRKKA